jgi:hypothetical protein
MVLKQISTILKEANYSCGNFEIHFHRNLKGDAGLHCMVDKIDIFDVLLSLGFVICWG